jgi:DNA polymerase III epsilon subunit-like protein
MASLIMAYDTETSGLVPKIDRSSGQPFPSINDYPYILQLSFVVYDVNKKCIVQKYNEYIRIADDVVIPPKASEINGITKQICNLRGIPIERALADFHEAYMSVDRVVAHNIAFDRKMIEIEVLRNMHLLRRIPTITMMFNDTFNDVNNIETVCTMNRGKDICNLYITNEKGGRWKKSPKLSELHFRLFDYVPMDLHDALVDTMACMRCYLKLALGIDMPLEDV